ncbi:MAG: agmatine deiminase family protein [Polyangiaceae bacterium]|jgi:agmatine/peptidylarginine deiminase|nr:agmatine deiminase family protein [Polyangiaceae bacterium]
MKKFSLLVAGSLVAAVGCQVHDEPSDTDPTPSTLAPAPANDPENTVSQAPALPAELQKREPLPAFMTDQERQAVRDGVRPFWLRSTSPPAGDVSVPAEFALSEAVIVRIPMYSDTQDYFGQLVHQIVLSGATPFLLVDDTFEANTVVEYFLSPYGTNEGDVRFLYTVNDAFWSRDFGPYFVFVDGERAIVDTRYYPTRPNDDYLPIAMAAVLDEDVYSTPLSTEGGNFMTDGLGTCWASTGILSSNDLTQSQARAIYQNYLGCDTVRFVPPLPGEGTTHIDMFSKILSTNTILVAYSSTSLGASKSQIDQLESAAQFYASTPKPGGGNWNIVRIPMVIDNRNEVFNAYTNSLIVNNSVLVPTYGYSTDAEALRVYREAMPGYRVIGIPSSSIISLGGSVHCTTMQVPADSSTPIDGACGDGDVDPGEVCDRNTIACNTLGSGFASGTAACNAHCTGWDTTDCTLPPGSEQTLQARGTLTEGEHVLVDDGWTQASAGRFLAQMTGTGDADLYVWKDVSSPTWDNFSCRPYLEGSVESCALNGPGRFLVAVRGFSTSSTFAVTVTFTP